MGIGKASLLRRLLRTLACGTDGQHVRRESPTRVLWEGAADEPGLASESPGMWGFAQRTSRGVRRKSRAGRLTRPLGRAILTCTHAREKSLSMSQKAVKLGVTSLVLVLAFGGLLYSTLSEGTEYYKHVDEVMTNPEAWQGKRLQLHGFVVPKSIYRNRDSLDWRGEGGEK